MTNDDPWRPPYDASAVEPYDYMRDWPGDERSGWTGVVARVMHNRDTGVIRIALSGEWPDQAVITDHTMIVERTVNGRLMQIDLHGVHWE